MSNPDNVFGPIGDSQKITITAASQRWALGTLFTASPAIMLIGLSAAQGAWYLKFGGAGVTVSLTDGVRYVPGSISAPLMVPVPSGTTHVAILAEGASGDALLSSGGMMFGDFSPLGDGSQTAISSTDQHITLPALASSNPSIRLVGMQGQMGAVWVKLGNVAVVGSLTTSHKYLPGSADDPTIIPVLAGQTHLSVFCEGAAGLLLLHGGSVFTGGSSSPAPGSVTNAMLADMAAWTFKVRNAATTGVPSDMNSAAATTAVPVAADFLLGFLATGEIRKYLVSTISGSMPRGHIFGLLTSNNATDAANDIDVATGEARSDDNTTDIILASAITKRLDAAWAVGTNQGGLDTGAEAASTFYYVWLIRDPTNGITDVLFSLSATAPTLPTNYTKKRRIGSIRNDAASAILAYTQNAGDPDLFLLTTPVRDINITNLTTASQSLTLASCPPNMIALFRAVSPTGDNTLQNDILIRPLTETDAAPSQGNSPGVSLLQTLADVAAVGSILGAAGAFEIPVNASSQIGARATRANTDLRITTRGWMDRRGRLN